MALKENFPLAEWENFLTLPYAVSMTVVMSAPTFIGIWGETKAMIQAPANLAAAGGSGLVGLVLAETQSRVQDLVTREQVPGSATRQDTGQKQLMPAGLQQRLSQRCPRKRALRIKNGSSPSA